MLKILIINPNTSEHFNRLLQATADNYSLDSTELKVISPKSGPSAIEGVYDEALSVQGTVEVFLEWEQKFDGFIVACYSDHLSVYALREISRKPVIGIAEASIHLACLLGNKFSIVTTNERWGPLLTEAVKKYGVESRCASVRTTNDALQCGPQICVFLILGKKKMQASKRQSRPKPMLLFVKMGQK